MNDEQKIEPEVRAGSPEAGRMFFDDKRLLQDYFELARMARPGAGFEDRMLAAVHKAARGDSEVRVRGEEPRADWIFPAWRWAAAASLMLALGLWVTLRNPGLGAAGIAPQPMQSAAPVIDFQHLLPAATFPDPSPPSVAAGSFSRTNSNPTERTNLYLIRE